jgi:hypothetical protein
MDRDERIMSVVTSSPTGQAESSLQKERQLFRELFARLRDAVINSIFDLRPERAMQRMQYLVVLFFVSIFLVILTHKEYGPGVWAQYLRTLFQYLLNPSFAATYNGDPFREFLGFVYRAVTDPHTLQYVPLFLASFFIGLQSAAIYLADIFELEDVSIARSFVSEVALSGSDETIRIKEGEISELHRESSNYLIGGPGKVIVDIDSVALFEKPDGTPHIIGPTGKEHGGRATIDGFERFRQAIDIRDHHVDLQVKSRSRDGIPITASDVRLMFSVYRGERPKKEDQFPYPFSKEAIEQIVYKSVSRVTPDLPNPSTYEFSWIDNMLRLIRGRLGGFMSERNLSVYLASIGLPELEKAKQREALITEQVQKLIQQTDDPNVKKDVKKPPEFTPRSKISSLFSQFAEEFTRSARDNGVQLQWIGVGTWKTSVEVVPEKHLEAWKISQENLKNSSAEALRKVENEAILKKMESLIKSVPLEAYDEITSPSSSYGGSFGKQSKKSSKKSKRDQTTDIDDLVLFDESGKSDESMDDMLARIALIRAVQQEKKSSSGPDRDDADHRTEMRALLMEYRTQFIETIEFIKSRGEAVPAIITDALKYIEAQLGMKHWVGKP